MKTISKRELNHQTARVLSGVREGEPVVVTERGVPRWRIESIDAAADPVARLRAQGRITAAAKNPPPWPTWTEQEKARYTPAGIDALHTDMRGNH